MIALRAGERVAGARPSRKCSEQTLNLILLYTRQSIAFAQVLLEDFVDFERHSIINNCIHCECGPLRSVPPGLGFAAAGRSAARTDNS